MAQQERFRPYIGLPLEYERLQALRDVLDWVYSTYVSPDHFAQDLRAALTALRMDEVVEWGKEKPAEFVAGLSLTQCKMQQLRVQSRLEDLLDPPTGKPIPTLSPITRVLVKRDAGRGKSFYVSAYKASDYLGDEWLIELILLRFFDLLSGLNTEALVRCAVCQHYTIRRHPRGKTYCSPNCRVKAAIAARKQAQGQRKAGKRKQPVSRRGRKEEEAVPKNEAQMVAEMRRYRLRKKQQPA